MVGDYFVDQPAKADLVKTGYASYLEAKTNNVCADPLKDPDSILVQSQTLLEDQELALVKDKLPTIKYSALVDTMLAGIKDKTSTLDPAVLASVGLSVPVTK
jgi:hypothetical protein